MKKLIALLAVCGFAIAFAACGKKTETAAQDVDTTATEVVVEEVPAADTTATDTTATD